MKSIRWTRHATSELSKREIDIADAELTIRQPESVASAEPPRHFHQRRYYDKILAQEMLLRVLVEEAANEIVVVTLYKTSKFDKYEKGKVA